MAKNPHKEAQKKLVWRTNKYASKVGKLYSQAVNDLLDVTKKVNTAAKKGEMFSYEDNPEMAKAASDILRRLHSDTYAAVKHGIQLEWAEGNKAADQFLATHFGKQVLNDPNFAAWTSRNTDALEAFFKRTRDDGMTLSKRIWKQTKQLRGEMELAMTVSIGEGESAADISRRVRKYLKDPDKLFRRIKETQEDGSIKWKLSKAAAAYHPGRGMYRSSAKNAMRVARTETNIAYRTADAMRWEEMDFVTGVHVKLSHNHPTADICDVLQGIYPKNFVFKGWHPQCFCYAEPVTASYEDMIASSKAMLAGEQPPLPKDMVTELPDNFKKWVKENQGRIAAAQQENRLPYFLKDNFKGKDIAKEIDMWSSTFSSNASPTAVAGIKAVQTSVAKVQQAVIAPKQVQLETISDWTFGLTPPSDRASLEAVVPKLLEYCGRKFSVPISKVSTSDLLNYYRTFIQHNDVNIARSEKLKLKAEKILSKLPPNTPNEVLEQYNAFIKQFNGNSIETYYSSRNALEGIINLSELQAAKVDFEKISMMMPAELLPGKNIISADRLLNKEFFDNLKEFVPMKVSAKSSHYRINHKEVNFNWKDRRWNFEECREKVIYHEYGHAMDHQDLFTHSEIDALMDKFRDKFNEIIPSSGISFFNEIDKILADEYKSLGSYYATDMASVDHLCAVMDTIQSLTKGRHGCINIDGHDFNYWYEDGSCRAEFIAHLSEFANTENAYGKKLIRELFEEMRDLGRKFLNLK